VCKEFQSFEHLWKNNYVGNAFHSRVAEGSYENVKRIPLDFYEIWEQVRISRKGVVQKGWNRRL